MHGGWVKSGRTSLLARQKNKIIAIRHIFWAQNVFKCFAVGAVPGPCWGRLIQHTPRWFPMDLGDCFAAGRNDSWTHDITAVEYSLLILCLCVFFMFSCDWRKSSYPCLSVPVILSSFYIILTWQLVAVSQHCKRRQIVKKKIHERSYQRRFLRHAVCQTRGL